jgi:hypothetical protein
LKFKEQSFPDRRRHAAAAAMNIPPKSGNIPQSLIAT